MIDCPCGDELSYPPSLSEMLDHLEHLREDGAESLDMILSGSPIQRSNVSAEDLPDAVLEQ